MKILVNHWTIALTRGCCSISLAIAIMAITGHITNHKNLYSWTPAVGMGLNTGISILCLSIAGFVGSLVLDKLLKDK